MVLLQAKVEVERMYTYLCITKSLHNLHRALNLRDGFFNNTSYRQSYTIITS